MSVANTVTRTAKALDEICQVLDGTGRGAWRGRAAEAFRERFDDEFRPKVKDAKDSFFKASRALTQWAEDMPCWQRDALQWEQKAQAEKTKAAKASRALGELPFVSPFDHPDNEDERKKQEETDKKREHLESVRDSASAELERIRGRAENLAKDYIEAGKAIADRLDRAMDVAPDEPGMLDRIGDAIEGVGDALGELAGAAVGGVDDLVDGTLGWIEDHAKNIAAVGDVFAAASALLGAVSTGLYLVARFTGIPHVGAAAFAVGQVSAGMAGAALVTHGAARLAGADVSNRTLAQDAVGAIPFGTNVRFIGNTGRAIARSRHVGGASNLALADSWRGLIGNPDPLKNFIPKDNRQRAQAFVPAAGGLMMVAIENAWKSA